MPVTSVDFRMDYALHPGHRRQCRARVCRAVSLRQRGRFLEARIDDLGTRVGFDQQRAQATFQERIAELGPVDYCRIEVQPFEVQRFGTAFGLVPRPPEDDYDGWWVELQPGNYMAFHEPWD